MSTFVQFFLCSDLLSKLDKNCTKIAIFDLQLAKNDSNATFWNKNANQ